VYPIKVFDITMTYLLVVNKQMHHCDKMSSAIIVDLCGY